MGRTAIVVGAGLSGLTAAHRLQQSGFEVTVLEAASTAGGRVQTERHGDYLVDTGPDALTESYKRYLALLQEMGLSDRLVRSSQVAGIVRDGRVIDLDPAKPWQLPTSPFLSLPAKLRLVTGAARLWKQIRATDSSNMVASAGFDDPDVSAYDFAVERFGRENAERLLDGVLRLVTGSGSREASRVGLIAALGSWSVPLVNVRGGLAALPDALAARLSVRYDTEVTHVAESADGVLVDFVGADGEKERSEADVCVIAAMYHAAREIWPPLERHAPEFGAHLRNAKLISVSLGYSARTSSRAYPVLIPTQENPEALLIFLQHNKAPDRAPPGHSLVTVLTDTLATDHHLSDSDAELEEWAAQIIESLCPELRGRRDLAVVTRWPKAGYLARPGFWRHARALLQSIPEGGRIQLAGDLFGAGSMESAITGAERAAERLARGFGEPGAVPRLGASIGLLPT